MSKLQLPPPWKPVGLLTTLDAVAGCWRPEAGGCLVHLFRRGLSVWGVYAAFDEDILARRRDLQVHQLLLRNLRAQGPVLVGEFEDALTISAGHAALRLATPDRLDVWLVARGAAEGRLEVWHRIPGIPAFQGPG